MKKADTERLAQIEGMVGGMADHHTAVKLYEAELVKLRDITVSQATWIREHESAIPELQAKIAERSCTVASLRETLADREAEISGLCYSVTNRDGIIVAYGEKIRALEASAPKPEIAKWGRLRNSFLGRVWAWFS